MFQSARRSLAGSRFRGSDPSGWDILLIPDCGLRTGDSRSRGVRYVSPMLGSAFSARVAHANCRRWNPPLRHFAIAWSNFLYVSESGLSKTAERFSFCEISALGLVDARIFVN